MASEEATNPKQDLSIKLNVDDVDTLIENYENYKNKPGDISPMILWSNPSTGLQKILTIASNDKTINSNDRSIASGLHAKIQTGLLSWQNYTKMNNEEEKMQRLEEININFANAFAILTTWRNKNSSSQKADSSNLPDIRDKEKETSLIVDLFDIHQEFGMLQVLSKNFAIVYQFRNNEAAARDIEKLQDKCSQLSRTMTDYYESLDVILPNKIWKDELESFVEIRNQFITHLEKSRSTLEKVIDKQVINEFKDLIKEMDKDLKTLRSKILFRVHDSLGK